MPAGVPVGLGEALRRRFRALRAFSLPVSVLPVLVAAAAALPVSQWRWGVLAASVAGAALLHLAGNLLNDYFDFRSGVDRKVAGDEGRPGRLLVRAELRPSDVLIEAGACLAALVPVLVWLVWQCGPGLLAFGAAALLAAWCYTGPPLRLKYHALGEPVIFLTFGPLLMAGAAYAQTGRLDGAVLLLAIPVGFATTAVLVGNNLRDEQEDRQAGIRTISHFAGARPARLLYVGLVTASALGVAGAGAIGLGPRILVAAPALLVMHHRAIVAVWRHQRLPDIDARTARFAASLLAVTFVAFCFHTPG